MFCPNCGNQLPEGSKFCGSCGANLSSEDKVQKNDNIGFEQTATPVKTKKKLDPKKIVIVAVVLLVAWIIGKAVGGGMADTMNGNDGAASDTASTTSSNQFDFGLSETPTVGIRENVETMVFEVEAEGFLSSRVTISCENDVVIAVKGYYNILDLTHKGADISKNTIDVVCEMVRTSDLYNVTINVEPGYNTLDCDFIFTSLDGSNAREANRILATLFGFSTNNSDVLYMSSVKNEMMSFGYKLVDSY